MAKPASVKTLIVRARESMTALGVYKPEFEPIIEIYAGLCHQYNTLNKRFNESDYEFEVSTAQGMKKAPIVTTLEALRKDIVAYSVQLGLTPAGLKKIKDAALDNAKPMSILDRVCMDANG